MKRRVSSAILVGCCVLLASCSQDTDTVIKLGDVCVSYDTSAPQITEQYDSRRGALNSTSLGMRLDPDDPETDFTFSLHTAGLISEMNGGRYWGECTFTSDGPAPFDRMVPTGGLCSGGMQDTYALKPGSPEVIIVRCIEGTFRHCGMSLYHDMSPFRLSVRIAVLDNPPDQWLEIADRARKFVDKSVAATPC